MKMFLSHCLDVPNGEADDEVHEDDGHGKQEGEEDQPNQHAFNYIYYLSKSFSYKETRVGKLDRYVNRYIDS